MTSLRALEFVALVCLLAGCGASSVSPREPDSALTDADFDGWRGNADEKQSIDPAQAGGILSAILDRVESIEAKLRPPAAVSNLQPPAAVSNLQPPAAVSNLQPSAAVSNLQPQAAMPDLRPQAAVPDSTRSERRPRDLSLAAASPSPAPPAEAAGDGPVETVDIPRGWTGAAVYHAATCQHCPALLAGLRSRATKVSGNYLCIDGCWFLLVDWAERPDVERPKIPGLPAVLYFVDGHERPADRVIGFGNRPGELEFVINRHPLHAKRAAGQAGSVTSQASGRIYLWP